MLESATGAWKGYAIAVGLTAAAFGVRLALDPWLGGASPLLTFTLAVMAAAIGGGLGPGLAATGLSAVAGAYFLGRDGIPGYAGEAVQLVVFAFIGGGISLLAERFLAARRRAEEDFAAARADKQRIAQEVAERKEAAAELQTQKDLLQTTLTSAGDGMIATDTEGRVTFLNPVAQELTGWSQDEAVGLPLTKVFRIINEETRAEVDNPALRALRDGVIIGLANHTVLIAKDGTERPIDDSAAPIREPGGETRGAVLVFRDISERKQTEIALAERNSLVTLRAEIGMAFSGGYETSTALQRCCEAIVKHLDAAFVRVWTINQTGETLELKASAGLYTHLDGPHGRVKVGEFKIGRIAASKQPHLTNAVPDDPNVSDQDWAKREGMIAFAGFPLIVENRVIGVVALFARKPLSEGVLADLAPIADGIAQFIDRRRSIEQLRESEERTRSVLESITDGFFAIDRDWRFTYLNREAERLLGRTQQELLGKDLREEYPEGVAAEFLRAYQKAMAENVPVTFEAYFGPHERWYDVRVYPAPEGLAVYFRDVTERKRAEEALRRANDELEIRVIERTAELHREKRFLEALLENIQDGIVACDADGVLTLFNRATREFHGLPPEPIPAEQWAEHYDLFLPDGVTPMPPDEVPLFRALKGERVENAEMVIAPKNGPARTLLASGRSFQDADGQKLGAVVSMHDVTERKQAEEEVRRSHDELEARVAERTAELAGVNAALRSSEARKTAMLDSALDCVIAIDHEGLVVDFNPAAERTFGYSRAEVLGREMAEFIIPPAFRDQHRRGIAHYLATGEGPVLGRRIEISAIRKDGEEFPVELSITSIQTDPPLFTGYLRDITERKRWEEALQQSEERFRTLAEAVPQIVWVTRPDGWHEFFNARWYEYTGLTPEESLGDSWAIPLHPEDRSRSEARWKQATDSGEPYEIEYRFRRHDGTYRWFLGRAVPVRDDAGQITRWFGTCTDIDDAKRAEQKAAFLADASSHLAELLDYRSTMQKVAQSAVPAFSDWITMDLVGEDGTLRRLATTHADRSKERLANELAERYPPRHDDPQGPARVFRTGDPELVSEVDETHLSTLARDDDHRRLLRELGFRSYMSVPLVTKGRVTGVMTFVAGPERRYDVSDLLVAEDLGRRVSVAVENVGLYEALKEADQRKDEFLATLAHELRNPLAPIRMGLEVLRLGGDDPATVNEMLGTMEGQVRQMVRLIDDLLDVSRITRGKLDLRKTRVDLKDVAKTAVETVRPLTDEARHELIVSLPDESLILDGDPARLSQILSNLLNNAVKYTPEEGRISLKAERQGSDVMVSVKDTGLGIPPDMLEKVFEMFAQVDRTLERSHGGLGIGLHLVKRLVEMHGGSVEAHSEGEGRGSEFTVRLPLVVSPTEATPEGTNTRSEGTIRRVLVADDNRDAADMLARVLRALGHEVRTAYDGEQAIAAAESFRPDVCLLDIGMPKRNGYDVARSLRGQAWGQPMFLVALTGWGAEEDRRRSREAGFDRHLVKPVEPAVLRELLTEPHRTPT